MKKKTWTVMVMVTVLAVVVVGAYYIHGRAAEKSKTSLTDAHKLPAPVYTIGGIVTGLSDGQVLLQLNGGGEQWVTKNGHFTIPTMMKGGTPYAITIKEQPKTPVQTCQIKNGNGQFSERDVTDVVVTCSPWTKEWGGGDGERGYETRANAVVTDPEGNIYVAGQTEGNMDGSNDSSRLDAFIAKYDAAGNLVFARERGSDGMANIARGVSVDQEGNAYVVGEKHIVDHRGYKADISTLILIKYDQTGKEIYRKISFNKNSHVDMGARGVATDNKGNVYVVGYDDDQFLLKKFDPSGNEIYTKEDSELNGASSIAIDAQRNIYVIGGVVMNHQGHGGFYLAKFDEKGKRVQLAKVGPEDENGVAAAKAVTVDKDGNVYVTGHITGDDMDGVPVDGDPGMFLVKFDKEGKKIYTKVAGVERGRTFAQGIATDAKGNVFVVGDTFPGLFGNKMNGSIDIFVSKYNKDGKRVFTKQISPKNENSSAYAVTTDPDGHLFVVGETSGGLDGYAKPVGDSAFFVLKLDSDGNVL